MNRFKVIFLSLASTVFLITSCGVNKNSANQTNNNGSADVPSKVEITWETHFESERAVTTCRYGWIPEVPITPKSYEEDGCTYTFDGWYPTISVAIKDTTYKAKYKCDKEQKFKIEFDAKNGSTPSAQYLKFGEYPIIPFSPIKPDDDNYHYSFVRWFPDITTVKGNQKYEAQYKQIPLESVSCTVNCEGCTVNGKSYFYEESTKGHEFNLQFQLTSSTTFVGYPIDVDFKVDGVASKEYTYDNTTGLLKFNIRGNTVISAKADNYIVKMVYSFDTMNYTIAFNYSGTLDKVDWGDNTTVDQYNSFHTYDYLCIPGTKFVIKIYGQLTDFKLSTKDTLLSVGNSFITNIDIYRGITTISDYAFCRCDKLISIHVPKNLTALGKNSFEKCKSLTSFVIPNGITELPERVFWSCRSLTSLYIPNSVTKIGNGALMDCVKLTSIFIPSSVYFFDDNAFFGCDKLTYVDCSTHDKLPIMGKRVFFNEDSSFKLRLKNVELKNEAKNAKIRPDWSEDNIGIKHTQIIASTMPVLSSTKYYHLEIDFERDTYQDYSNKLMKNSNINFLPNNCCFEIKVGNRQLVENTDYTYNSSTGEFAIKEGVIDDAVTIYPKTLEDFSWSEIKEISSSGRAEQYFHLGETKELEVNGVTHRVRIIGFNQDKDSSDNSIGITFEFIDLLSDENGYSLALYWNDIENTSESNYDYTSSTLVNALNGNNKENIDWFRFYGLSEDKAETGKNRKFVSSEDTKYYHKSVLDMLPSGLSDSIVEPVKYVRKSTNGTDWTEMSVNVGKLFLLSPKEMGMEIPEYAETETTTYDYYVDLSFVSFIKKQINGFTNERTDAVHGFDVESRGGGSIERYSFAGYNDYKNPNVNGSVYWTRLPSIDPDSYDPGMVWYVNPNGKLPVDDFKRKGYSAYKYALPIAPAFCM